MSVLEFLQGRGGFYSLAEICAGTSVPVDDVERELRKLTRAGKTESREYRVIVKSRRADEAAHLRYAEIMDGRWQWRAK